MVDLWKLAFAAGLVLNLGQCAFAQSPPATLDEPTLLQRLEAQERRIQQLESNMSHMQRLPVPVAAPNDMRDGSPFAFVGETETGLTGAAPAENSELKNLKVIDYSKPEALVPKVKGRVHADYYLFASQDAASEAAFGDLENYFEFRRLRIGVAGGYYGVYEYEIEVDFEPENSFSVRNAAGTGSISIGTEAISLKDAYIGLQDVPTLGLVKFGHFKQPFSLEEMTSANYLSFMERGLPNAFSPGRDVGVAAFNHNGFETMTWGFGVFFNDIDDLTKQRVGDQQGVNLTGRVTWLPYEAGEERYFVHLGAGYIFADDSDNSVTFSSRPETHEEDSFITTGALAVENYQVGNVEGAVVWGPLSVQSEVFGVWTDGAGGAANDQYWGTYAYISYFLTGEHRPYDKKEGKFARVKPFTNFWIVDTCEGKCAGWGAWEALLRWSYLDLADRGSTAGGRGTLNDVTVGVNWYWTPHTRWMLNYIHAYGDRADVGQNDTDIVGMSLRFDF